MRRWSCGYKNSYSNEVDEGGQVSSDPQHPVSSD